MNYVVSWTRPALRQLHDLWISATDPDAVDAAATRIAQTLTMDADQQGERRATCASCSIRRSRFSTSPMLSSGVA